MRYEQGNPTMPYNFAVGPIRHTSVISTMKNEELQVLAWFQTREEAETYARNYDYSHGQFGKVSGP